MKTKRRHELQTNVLADWLGHQITIVRPYEKIIIGVVIAVAVVAVAATYLMKSQSSKLGTGWADYFAALGERDADRLRTVAESHPGTVAGLWAKQSEADLELARGVDALYSNRSEAKQSLRRARTRYDEVAQAATRHPQLQQRAWYGLAVVYESQSDMEKAREHYEKAAKTAPGSALGKAAHQRIEALQSPGVDKWYNWFANQKPALPSASAGGAAAAGLPAAAADLGNLPEKPDLTVPVGPESSPLQEQSPAAVELSPPKSQAAKPAAEAGAATSKPAASAPASAADASGAANSPKPENAAKQDNSPYVPQTPPKN